MQSSPYSESSHVPASKYQELAEDVAIETTKRYPCLCLCPDLSEYEPYFANVGRIKGPWREREQNEDGVELERAA
jgi:hypothetical protein